MFARSWRGASTGEERQGDHVKSAAEFRRGEVRACGEGHYLIGTRAFISSNQWETTTSESCCLLVASLLIARKR